MHFGQMMQHVAFTREQYIVIGVAPSKMVATKLAQHCHSHKFLLEWVKEWSSPFHKVHHVDDARCTDHRLVCEDGPHGLFHTELWF